MPSVEKLWDRLNVEPAPVDFPTADARKLLAAYGFEQAQGGNHEKWKHPMVRPPVTIARSSARKLKVEEAASIRDAIRKVRAASGE